MFEVFLNYFTVIVDVFKAIATFFSGIFGGDANNGSVSNVEDLIAKVMEEK